MIASLIIWILDWLAEKTTWVGFFAASSAFGFSDGLTDPQQAALIAIAISFFGMPDRKKIGQKED
jgi:hypothetical protein